jgi:hypothetical protein
MISDDEHDDVWTFIDNCGASVKVNVVVIDYPDNPGRSAFVSGVTFDGREVFFEDGKYLCDDGTELQLPLA